MKLFFKYIVLVLFFLSSIAMQAQEQENNKLTKLSINLEKSHSPVKATLLSAFVPGLGQFYNKKYWKIPLVWGAYVGAIYGVSFNREQYNSAKNIYKLYIEGDSETLKLYGSGREAYLISLKDTYKRNRDLMFLLTFGVHLLNIVDANVDAHFFTFNVSPDLSIKTEPILFNKYNFSNQATLGLQVSLRF